MKKIPMKRIECMQTQGTTSNIGVSIISLHNTPRLHTLKRLIINLMRLAHI